MTKHTHIIKIHDRIAQIDEKRNQLREQLNALDADRADLQTALRVLDQINEDKPVARSVPQWDVATPPYDAPAKGTMRYDLWQLLPIDKESGWHRKEAAMRISDHLGRKVSIDSTSAELSRLRKVGLAESAGGKWYRVTHNSEGPAEAGPSSVGGVAERSNASASKADEPDHANDHTGSEGSNPSSSAQSSVSVDDLLG